jgi:dienelactone hydrolase
MAQVRLPVSVLLMILIACALTLEAQTTPDSVVAELSQSIQSVDVTAFQLQRYLMKRIPKRPSPSSPAQWQAAERKLRKHILEDVAFHGWPPEWVQAPPKFQQTDVVETGNGYRLRKLRYEIVPGFDSVAILYEPQNIDGRVPAILNVIGHEHQGEAAEYEQKRCINFAKRGIVALSVGWMGYGELEQPENAHDYATHLDLVGSNALGLFYLAMRRGLDYLTTLPYVDPARLGVTGISGGGWQTTVLSALDERVAVSVEVAGIGSLESNLTHPVDTDEVEENATDLTDGEDYSDFVAMRAPRPTLLIHNAEDTCCFRAALVKPYIYDQVQPFFRLFGQPDALGWHENRDPGTHNYQIDNREQAYRFFTEHFHLPVVASEIPSAAEIRDRQELAVGLPPDNLTIVGVANKLASQITRPPIPAGGGERAGWITAQRRQLESVIRYHPISVENAWRMTNTKHLGLQTLGYRFDFSNGLSATGVWLEAISAEPDVPATIILHDKGRKAAGEMVSARVNRGEQVLALDLLFNGSTIPQDSDPADWEMLVATTGDRPLGLEVAQLLAAANWLKSASGRSEIRLETEGIRNQVVGLTAAAIEPQTFSQMISGEAMRGLGYLIDTPIPFRAAPELFCLDLYKDFDLDRLAVMAAPTKITAISYAVPPADGRTGR